MKDILKKDTFVHNCLANKRKSNVDHFKKIFNSKVLTEHKRALLKVMHKHGIDFRMLTAFKNALFDSEELIDNQFVPIAEFKELQ